jgi:ribosomal protein S18 acetylase RimI-like enzyme
MSAGEPDPYEIREEPPDPETFAHLREVNGMSARSLEAIERGLPNSIHCVIAVHDPSGEVVGMGRIIGDDGAVYQLSDMAIHPDHQRRGLGTRLMRRLETHLEREAPPSAYVNLVADVDGFYERFGYEEIRPDSKGMHRWIE